MLQKKKKMIVSQNSISTNIFKESNNRINSVFNELLLAKIQYLQY